MARARAPARGRRARRVVATIGVLALLALLTIGLTLLGNRVPLRDPPGVIVRLSTYMLNNRVETSENPRFPERRSMLLDADVDTTAARLRDVLVALNWTVLGSEPGRVYLGNRRLRPPGRLYRRSPARNPNPQGKDCVMLTSLTRRPRLLSSAAALVGLTATAFGQDFNIDFGTVAGSVPGTYRGAACQDGTWNHIDTTLPVSLRDVDGGVNGGGVGRARRRDAPRR